MRYPTTSDQNAVSQNNLVAQQLDNSAATFRSRLYTLLTNYHNYSTFSNEAWINSNDNPNNYDSIESLHDQIHGLTGSGGHMGYIEYSAFDPIFWLHHAMVDRCFALWETLNPNTYVVPEPARYNSFTTRANSIQDINTPLTPFHKDASGAFWTSADVHDTSTFGYAYRETASYPGQNVTANVISAINTLYGPGAISSSGTQSESKSKRTRVIPTTPVDLSVDGLYTEWIANIKVKKYALGVPFFIHIFIGPFDPDPFSWSFESNLVGTHSIFVKAGECNCDTEQMISATIPLTDALAKHFRNGDLESLSPKDVNAFLTNNGTGQFQYRITIFNDTAVANGDVRLSSLKIGVLSSEVQMPAQVQDLPQWGPLRGRFEITTG
jgi:tyrosinase